MPEQAINPGWRRRPCVVILPAMLYFALKAALSGLIVAAVSEIARRSPAFGALVASLPLVSILGMLWLWHDTREPERLAAHAGSTFWMVLPSLPMFLILPLLLRHGVGFHLALLGCCALTAVLYALMVWLGGRYALRF